jgi:hypothetical protein
MMRIGSTRRSGQEEKDARYRRVPRALMDRDRGVVVVFVQFSWLTRNDKNPYRARCTP